MQGNFEDCRFEWDGSFFTVANSGISRRWDLRHGAPVVCSVCDMVRGIEWFAPAPYRNAFYRNDLPLTALACVTVDGGVDDNDGASMPHLKIVARLVYPNAELFWTHRIWPGLPLIMSGYDVRKTASDPAIAPEKFHDAGGFHLHPVDDRLDFFGLAPLHLAYHAVEFVAQSDYHDNLVLESSGYTYPKENLRKSAHIMCLTDRCGSGGLVAVKLAPAQAEQLNYPGFDFACSGMTLAIAGSGISSAELDAGDSLPAYHSAVGFAASDDRQGMDLFYEFMRKLYPPCPSRNFSILSNTWGDGNGSKKVNEKMFSEEIRIAADLGLTHCQVDAGWQKGNFADLGVEENRPKGPYGIDPDFWSVHKDKFPQGLMPVVELAREHGMRLGLWFNPDCTNDYANWRRDADVILDMWRKYDFQNVKLDGVSILSKRGEVNFMRLAEALYMESDRAICINFDITGGKSWRTGHLYRNEYFGNLFVENRYALDRSYFPCRTLRNLWWLCRYIPSYRLQMEFVNTEIRKDNYGDDPLAPVRFGTEFSCAVALFSNPLCWMEVGGLAAADRRKLKKLLDAYRPHQQAILCGRVYPIGEEPSGTAWTGFQSVSDQHSGYLIFYREWNDRRQAEFKLHGVAPGAILDVKPLAGHCRQKSLRAGRDGIVRVSLAKPRSYGLIQYAIRQSSRNANW